MTNMCDIFVGGPFGGGGAGNLGRLRSSQALGVQGEEGGKGGNWLAAITQSGFYRGVEVALHQA